MMQIVMPLSRRRKEEMMVTEEKGRRNDDYKQEENDDGGYRLKMEENAGDGLEEGRRKNDVKEVTGRATQKEHAVRK